MANEESKINEGKEKIEKKMGDVKNKIDDVSKDNIKDKASKVKDEVEKKFK